ncbi:MAG: prepilin-type N-terminal cleavage/methylation domain-containing protein [Proteocatella sp.]
MKKLNRDKKTINIFKRTLSNNRGETLVEGIVSLLMLAILMAGAYAMITSSLSIISTAYENDKTFKTEVNSVIEGAKTFESSGTKIAFKIDGIISEAEKVELEYELYNKNGIVAFKPKTS